MSAGPSEMHSKILDSAISLLETGGEPAVRLRSIAKMVGITEPTLYHYFKDRESLIVAAHTRRLKVNLTTTIEPFLAAVHSCQNQAEFLDVFLGISRYSWDPGRKIVREARAELIGASIKREDLRNSIVEEINTSLEPSIEALNFAKSKGWLRQSIDSKSLALFYLSVVSSAIYVEMQNDEALFDHWTKLASAAITALVLTAD